MTFTDEYNAAIEAAAVAAEAPNRTGREWVPGSHWDEIRNEMAREFRKLKQHDQYQARAKVGGVTGKPASDSGGEDATPCRSR